MRTNARLLCAVALAALSTEFAAECAEPARSIYWATQDPAEVYEADLTTGAVRHVLSFKNGTVDDIALDPSAGTVYLSSSDHAQTRRETTRLLDFGQINRVDLAGGKVIRVFTTGESEMMLNTDSNISSGNEAPHGLAIDAIDRKIYWCEFMGARVRRCDFAGGNVETLVADAGQGRDLALDRSRRMMYWITFQERLERANLDGTARTVLLEDLPGPRDVEFDERSDKLYWADRRGIMRAERDGRNPQVVFDRSEGSYLGAIAIDSVAGALYWVGGNGEKIFCADLDGGNTREVVSDTRGRASTIALSNN